MVTIRGAATGNEVLNIEGGVGGNDLLIGTDGRGRDPDDRARRRSNGRGLPGFRQAGGDGQRRGASGAARRRPDGANLIGLKGWNNTVTQGDGDNRVLAATAGNTRVTGGDGANTIELQGWNNEIALGHGGNKVWAGIVMSRITRGDGADQVWIGASAPRRFRPAAGAM